MVAALEALIAPIRHSPLLNEAADALLRQIRAESELRKKFYDEITPSDKAEFIDGAVVMHSPARNIHLDHTKFISQILDLYARRHGLGEVKIEKCLCQFPRNDYEPDVVYFGKEKASAFDRTTLIFPPPDMAVEVISESTEARDRGVKFEDYAAHGVQEYWIVDSEKQSIEQYLLEGESYRLAAKQSSGELRCHAIPGLVVPVAACFSHEANLSALKSLLD